MPLLMSMLIWKLTRPLWALSEKNSVSSWCEWGLAVCRNLTNVSLLLSGAQPLSIRQMKKVVQFTYPSIAWLVPEFVYFPGWLMAAGNHKFWLWLSKRCGSILRCKLCYLSYISRLFTAGNHKFWLWLSERCGSILRCELCYLSYINRLFIEN